tara:strand:- start:23650 stop:24546 length:897 start_codon:yes stop_codon:yes gene_type:complete
MSKIPSISIGLPVYNGECFLKETIDSILDQTFTDFELIISDNASSDQTKTICREYIIKDKRIKYFQQTNNIGFFNNYSFVLQSAVGNYFLWIAADDLLADKEYLNNLLKNFRSDVDYVFSDVKIIDSHRNIIKPHLMLPFKKAKTRFDFAKASILNNSQILYGLFKTSKLREDFYLLEKFRDLLCYWEGYFVHVVSIERKGIFVPTACKLYRRHDTNLATKLIATKRLQYFLRYASASLKYFYTLKYFSIYQKFPLISLMLSRQICYLFRILLSLIAQKFPTINKWRRNCILYLRSKE